MRRRFEQDGRFWEIEHAGDRVRIAWGAPGKPTQRLDRDFETREAAAAYVDKQIAAQVAKGFAEVVANREDAPRLPDARHARFEWVADGAQWYRELVLSGTKVHDRSGTIDERGREHIDAVATERCPTLEVAHARFDAMCVETQARGGEQIDLAARAAQRTVVPRQTAVRVARPRYSELEAQCLESPDVADPWIVYADHLEATGDPRGRIAALARAGEPLAFDLKFGFVRHVQIALDDDATIALDVVTRRLLAAPIARFVDSLRFGLAGFEGNHDWAPTLAIAAHADPRVGRPRAQGGRRDPPAGAAEPRAPRAVDRLA